MNQPIVRTGGRILVDALKTHGTSRVFCVPGESYLPVLDALYDEQAAIQLVTCRQEGGAAFMAEAHGKLTGAPGVCFVTRGPGATNASIGVHTARQDSTPMILFVGQVGRDLMEREAFQEIDYRRMYGQMAKWVASIDSVERIPEYVHRAYQTAVAGRAGPVVLALPEDVLAGTACVENMAAYRESPAYAGANDLACLEQLLESAQRPLMILGGSGWTVAAKASIQAFSERVAVPVAVSFRRQDLFDNRHPNYAGHVGLGIAPSLAQRVRQSDLLLVVGSRLSEATTGAYTLITPRHPGQILAHVYPDPQELGRVHEVDLPMNAHIAAFAAQTAGLRIRPNAMRESWRHDVCSEYGGDLALPDVRFEADLAEVVTWLNEHLPDDAIVTNGAGNYAGWVHRYYQYSPQRRQLAPTNGAMGYGVPAAVAAKLEFPARTVVCFSGDGCFMMNGQELATAVQYGAAVVFIVVNNGMYGTIRMHQEAAYPGRVSGTTLSNPDFAALAHACGAYGQKITSTAEFPGAFERALAVRRPALIEICTDPAAVSARSHG